MKHRLLWAAAIAAGLATLRGIPAQGQLASFPGAQGFGSSATGGRGGSIYVVTNYNSSGAGSFEDAVSESNRIVVFAVGGYVDMSAAISCASNLTILGQTAPGQGIAFEGHEISFNDSSNDIVQYIRAREGSADTSAKASINLGGSSNMMLDHVDAEFSQYDNIDAVGSPTTTNNITLQNSMIADPILAQQFNMHTEGSNTTYLNNIFANGGGRSVLAKSNSQFVNNVIYDYGFAYTTGNSGGTFSYDILGNYFIAGPGTNDTADAFYQLDNNQSAYSSGNLLDANKNGVLDGSAIAATTGDQDTMNTLTSEWSPTTKYLPTLSATAAYNFDIAHAGALYPNGDGTFSRDQVDAQVVSQVESLGTAGRIMNEQDDTGLSNDGFGTLTTATVGANTLDTVPFAWLQSHGLSTTSAAQLTLPDALGYDMIEEYAQQVGDQYASQTASGGDWATTTWSATTPGIYDHALIRGTGTANGTVTISASDADSAFSVSIGGNGPVAGESLNMSGGSLTVQDTIYVGDQNNGTLQMTAGTIRANNVQLGNTVWNANGSSSTTYTGTLILSGGILTTGQVVLGGGVAGSWTTGGSILWSGGTLQSIGTLNVNVPATLGAAGGILDTNGGTATLSGVISGAGPFKIIGGGTLSLTATNTYTGVTTISGATLSINNLVNAGVPSELGASSNAASNLVLDGGTLAGTGGTDRLFTLTANGGTLDNSGGVFFSNTGAIALPNANATLILTGTNPGHETFSPTLADPGNGFVTSVLKTGVGKWTFNATGDKTYSGTTNVSAGTLETLATNALSPNSNLLIASGAILEMHAYSSAINALDGAGIVQDSFNHSNDSLTIGADNGSGTFTGNLGNGDLPDVIKNGTGTQVLGGTDTYTGTTTINGGILEFDLAASIGGTGVSITVGSGATAAAGYAMDQTTFLSRITTTSTGTAALGVSDANNLDFSSATGANLPSVSLGAVGVATYTGTLTAYGSIYRLGGGGGELILPNANALSGNSSVIVSGAGSTVDITGTNSYTGTTTISNAATLDVAVLAIGGLPSGIGESSNAASNLILDGGTLAGVGSTDRLFTLTANGGTLDNSGGMIFTNTGAIALPAANVTLTLTGTNTGHETFSPTLTDPGSGFVTSVVKNGTGMWTFNTTGTKTYSGNTTVNAGTLETLGNDTLSPNSSIILGPGTILELHDSSQAINGLSGSGSVQNYFVAHDDTLTVGSDNGGGTFTGVINSGATLNLTKVGSGTQILGGANTYSGNTTISGGSLELSGSTVGTNILPSATVVSLTAAGATLDIEAVNQTIASLNGPSGASVILGGQSELTVDNATSTEFDGIISGNGSLAIQGGFALTLGGASTYTGPTSVLSGSLTLNGSLTSTNINVSSGAVFNVEGSLSALTTLTSNGIAHIGANDASGILVRNLAGLTIGSGGEVTVADSASQSNRTVIVTSSLKFAGAVGNWQGTLDLGSNDAIVHNGSLANLSSQIQQGFNNGNQNGSGGIFSSAAATDTTHLTALGVIQNSVDGTPTGGPLYGSGTSLGLFDGISPVDTDVLVKYTYYGDTNLDGKVDGSDYSRIDNGYLHQETGWFNGDFNYDGVVNGSDYTLIDNAFNTQGVELTDEIAMPTASIALLTDGTSSVPEPAATSILAFAFAALWNRRRR